MEFLLIASAHFMALLSPGPDFFLIMQTALRMRLQFAWAVCAGIAAANGVYISLAILGFEYVKTMPMLMQFLHYAGGGYLIYLGFLLLKAPENPITDPQTHHILLTPRLNRQFLVGFTSGILNPKNSIFYLSLFTAMVSPATPLRQRSLYGLWMAAMVLCWDMMIAAVINKHSIKTLPAGWLFPLEKIAGLALSFFGVLLFLQ